MTRNHTLYVDGAWQPGNGEAIATVQPATGEPGWQGAGADSAQVHEAVAAARAAFPAWAAKSVDERIAVVRRFGEALARHSEHLAEAIARETGKPLWESRTEAGAMQAKIEISIAAYHERTGTTSAPAGDGQRVLTHKPHGVMAVFGPYNFPGHLPNGHIVPALIAGNTVVFKPSEHAPETAEKTVKLWQESGLDAGQINLIQGAADAGRALAGEPGIDGVLFTGSARTGQMLHQAMAGQPGKILALEMGGNNPLIVDESVEDVDAAVLLIVQSAFLSAGQRCTCARRLFVPDNDLGERLIARLVEVIAELRVGAPFDDPEPFMGPVISAASARRVLETQNTLLDAGATALATAGILRENTALLAPGVLDVTGISAPDEEIFGPLLQISRYADWNDALIAANATRFGLSAGLIGDDRARFDQFRREIRAGIVNWNRPLTGASSAAPFGGVGVSGNHRASAYYAADYCAYPVASLESDALELPATLPPGVTL